MKNLNRRHFLKTSLFTAATVSWTAKSWSAVKGANDTIRVGTIGFKSRGQSHIDGMRKLAPEGVAMVALCDVDQRVLDAGLATAKKKEENVKGYTDMRKLFEAKDIDVVTIGTPNHWHSLGAIWAVQAGKDVYVEKPVSHNVWEGRQLVNAARKYNKIVQCGTQSRSSYGIKEAVEWVKAGNLGKIVIARGQCYKPRQSIGKVSGAQTVAKEINYDLWCGPAPLAELHREKLHYDWHWVWNYGNGDLGNQGIHQMDIARWFLGEMELAPAVVSAGGRLGYVDDGETPNTQVIFHDYKKAPLIFEVRGLPSSKAAQKEWGKNMDKFPKEHGGSVCVNIHCEGGLVHVPNYTGATAYDKDGKVVKEFKGASDHFENFINAVRSRKSSDLHAEILEGHLSSALCHTGNVSYRLGAKVNPNEALEKLKSQKDGADTVARMIEHLKANEVDLTKDKLTLGVLLKMDPKTEKFIGNEAANKMLTRDYRKPYVVPAIS
jgi:predicted dehydrogenase